MKKTAVAVCMLMLGLLLSLSAAAVPYESYVYERQTNAALKAPAAVVPQGVISGDTLETEPWNNPSDIAVDEKGRIYVLDAGNGRVLCIDTVLLQAVFILHGGGGRAVDFTGAQGLFVNNDYLYIADTENGRILRYELLRLAEDADTAEPRIIQPYDLLTDTEKKPFRPLKLAVDTMDRLFIVAEGVYEGMVELADDGKFLAYAGANRVQADFFEQIWRLFATKKQWESMQKFVPVEFSNICMDKSNFIFTTARGKSGNSQAVRRLNLNGTDVLKPQEDDVQLGDPVMSSQTLTRTKQAYFIDVAVGPYELFAALDQTTGRVFVYDYRCTLLYEFGGLGSQIGNFTSPCAMVWLPDNRFAVLDGRTADITVFEHTEYGKKLLLTMEYESRGEYEKAAEAYREILALNSNSEIAYVGVGKQLLRQERFKEAMTYFKLGNDRRYYSKAYEQYRQERLAAIIPVLLMGIGGAVVLSAVIILFKRIRRLRENIRNIRKMSRP